MLIFNFSCLLTGKVFYFSVAGPALSMLALNFVIFGKILHSNTCGRSEAFLRTNQDERKESIARAKAVFCISVLLGKKIVLFLFLMFNLVICQIQNLTIYVLPRFFIILVFNYFYTYWFSL